MKVTRPERKRESEGGPIGYAEASHQFIPCPHDARRLPQTWGAGREGRTGVALVHVTEECLPGTELCWLLPACAQRAKPRATRRDGSRDARHPTEGSRRSALDSDTGPVSKNSKISMNISFEMQCDRRTCDRFLRRSSTVRSYDDLRVHPDGANRKLELEPGTIFTFGCYGIPTRLSSRCTPEDCNHAPY
jgi:hypothetical protein